MSTPRTRSQAAKDAGEEREAEEKTHKNNDHRRWRKS